MADGVSMSLVSGSMLTIQTSLVLNNGSIVIVGDPVDKIREPGHGVAAWRHSSSVRYNKQNILNASPVL